MFYALALFSKTTACTLPAALLLILWWKKDPIDWRRLAQVVPFLALGAGMGLLTVWWEHYHQGTGGKLFAIGWLERILIASHAVWFYAGKLLWPVNLMFSYPRWTIDPANPLAYGWLAAGAGLGAVIYFARRFLGRGIEVAVLFFVATLSPLLGFIMLFTFRYTFVADHYQYIASIGLIALAAGGLTTAFRFWEKGTPLLKPAFCGGLLVVLGFLTWRQCGMYADLETLWRTTIAKNPNSFMAYNNLGFNLLQAGQLDEAISQFQEAIRLEPNDAEAYYNLGNALGKKGQADAAINQYQEAIRLKPNYAEARYNLGNALFRKGQIDEAISQFQEAIRLKPDLAEAHYNLGAALHRKGQTDEAISQFQEAIRLKPDFADAHYSLGTILGMKGQIDEAIGQFREAIRLKPDFVEAQQNLVRALEMKNGPAKAGKSE
jgi:tetratricopeptide (TPR) repeat protein